MLALLIDVCKEENMQALKEGKQHMARGHNNAIRAAS